MSRIRSRCTATASARILSGLACALLAGTATVRAADVTYERLINPEPQNWLTHHRDYAAQRHSPLDAVNKSNVKALKLAFAVPLGGKSAGESLEATPLVDDGFMYMVDSWGVVYKIDVRSGTAGTIVWKMTYAVNGKQYIAIASGVCCVRPSGQISNSLSSVRRNPELRNQSNATVLYVFGL